MSNEKYLKQYAFLLEDVLTTRVNKNGLLRHLNSTAPLWLLLMCFLYYSKSKSLQWKWLSLK